MSCHVASCCITPHAAKHYRQCHAAPKESHAAPKESAESSKAAEKKSGRSPVVVDGNAVCQIDNGVVPEQIEKGITQSATVSLLLQNGGA